MKLKIKNPSLIFTLSFVFLIFAGTLLLKLDISSNGPPLSWTEAFFTAVSGVCVTGLTVIDISSRLSTFGKFLLMLLVQVGGLGLMSFSVGIIYILGRNISIVEREAIDSAFSVEASMEIKKILKNVFFFTFAIEAGGAAVFF